MANSWSSKQSPWQLVWQRFYEKGKPLCGLNHICRGWSPHICRSCQQYSSQWMTRRNQWKRELVTIDLSRHRTFVFTEQVHFNLKDSWKEYMMPNGELDFFDLINVDLKDETDPNRLDQLKLNTQDKISGKGILYVQFLTWVSSCVWRFCHRISTVHSRYTSLPQIKDCMSRSIFTKKPVR